MDTQRLILFVIFAFSALFLWEAWQREHRAPPPVAQTAPAPSAEVPVPSLTAPPGSTAPANPNAAAAVAPAGETIAVRTDLYSADIDTAGAIITQVALNEHRDTEDKARPYLLLQKNADRTFVAQSGLLGEGLTNRLRTHRAARLFPVHARYQDAEQAELDGPVVIYRAGRVQRVR